MRLLSKLQQRFLLQCKYTELLGNEHRNPGLGEHQMLVTRPRPQDSGVTQPDNTGTSSRQGTGK